MELFVLFVSLIMDGTHISLFFREMGHGVIFQEPDALLAGIFTVCLILHKIDQLSHNLEESGMGLVDHIHPYIKLLIPG